MIAVIISLACLLPPVNAAVRDPFHEPSCAYCQGNRGIDYDTAPGTTVVAAAAGTVSFAGVVAGVRYVVILHGDGLRATYGRLATSPLARGVGVAAGELVGTTTSSFFFGLRDGDTYLDPGPLLGRMHFRLRLIPVRGAPRHPPPPVLRCLPVEVGARRASVVAGR